MPTTKLQRAEQDVHKLLGTVNPDSPFLFDPHLQLLAATVQSTEQERIRIGHRIGQSLNRLGINNSDGAAGNRVKLLTDLTDLPPHLAAQLPASVLSLATVQNLMQQAEDQSIKALETQMFTHPLWVKYGAHTSGVGLKQFARALSEIGDPFWITRYSYIYAVGDDPKDPATVPLRTELIESRQRTLSQLWSYCGYGVDKDNRAPHRTAGELNHYRGKARMRFYVIAAQQVKVPNSAYRPVYDATKEFYLNRGHLRPCPTCKGGAAANPTGSPMTPGHAHAAAIRRVAKQILTDIYDTAKGLHELAHEIQGSPVAA